MGVSIGAGLDLIRVKKCISLHVELKFSADDAGPQYAL
jgi:hypothetical protein